MTNKAGKSRSICVREAECSVPVREVFLHLEEVIKLLRGRGMRRSKALEALVTQMALHHRPVTLSELSKLPSLKGRDQATVYRLVMKLEEAGVVRRYGFRGRASHFQLVIPGHHHDYLVCKSCGDLAEVEVSHSFLNPLEKEISAKSEWRDVQHELEFYGICPECVHDSASGETP